MRAQNKGSLIDCVRSQEDLTLRHINPYLEKSRALQGYLLTEKDFLEQAKNTHPSSLFSQEAPLVVEIGCYLGRNLKDFCSYNKELNFIGLDITYKRVVKASQKLQKDHLENGKVLMMEGKTFISHLPSSCLSGLIIYFPDPWAKLSQKKHRLMSEEFFKLVKEKLKTQGFVWVKTDHEEYFSFAKENALKAGFYLRESVSCPPNPLNPLTPHKTPFETLFESQKLPSYSFLLSHEPL
jgi:tRNA (guanine-N7-)-methyltransferase